MPQLELSIVVQGEQTLDQHPQRADVHRFEQLFLERLLLIGQGDAEKFVHLHVFQKIDRLAIVCSGIENCRSVWIREI